ncbi:MAG: hypothetical protein K6F33_01955 [Bacteroidales bacterium]|nr:hypothetical protein [Bacteroidales bacterium]
MFAPGDIIYGYAKSLYRPKYKYAVSIFRDSELNILAQFTTSKDRRGYVIDAGKIIGVNPQTGVDFCFQKRTVLAYDYGFLYGTEQQLISQLDNPEIVCRMSEEEYINMVYALYKSDYTPAEYKPFLEKVLEDFYK